MYIRGGDAVQRLIPSSLCMCVCVVRAATARLLKTSDLPTQEQQQQLFGKTLFVGTLNVCAMQVRSNVVCAQLAKRFWEHVCWIINPGGQKDISQLLLDATVDFGSMAAGKGDTRIEYSWAFEKDLWLRDEKFQL